ncbi:MULTISPECIES: cytochrome c oxidase assembly protein [unclassified Sphingomonas]|uniref:cytochrome c oxidase assembly protein n=1 Tax=unclassified Sphingomonas TaxID=196159 RepID=UPI0009264B5E|nr:MULTISPECIES: cytochrome c oxidase assembly protein [unclassified Sphingomonas]MBN8848931.1 cytochrome c oxidase assembly protein [Sphingomonas sp.]MBS0285143.1 cytochrome c oxidase assembly protein [Pseudomonadota bacterium]OJV34395.1 MAG: cytochrome c oxidase assembly protein [Sphingomonas sp. 67-36]
MRIARTTRTALFAVLGICFMTGLAFASVPLYRLFCAATGLNGTTQRGLIAPGSVHHRIRIDFDANTSPHMPWRFVPEQGSETVEVGARDMAFFTATNRAAVPVTGTATYNVTPYQAGKYFTKIQCFCFTQQTLKPGETARMPVIFFVDPKILDDPDTKDVETITLSYTFYPVDSGKPAS